MNKTNPTTKQLEDKLKSMRQGCHDTYNGGHNETEIREAFHHGMDTVFNIMDDWLPEFQLDLLKTIESEVIGEVGNYPDESLPHDDKIFIATENDLKKRQLRKLQLLRDKLSNSKD